MKVLPTPTTRDHKGHTIRREPHRPDDLDTLARALTTVPAALLPTPAVNDMGAAYTPDTWDEWTAKMQAKHSNGNGHGKSLNVEPQRLLKWIAKEQRWGEYADAIARWEALTRPAPDPTETGPKGNPRLSARFAEWMMGVPDGWITDVPGVTHNEALKMAGNGVVPQQATAAVRCLLGRIH